MKVNVTQKNKTMVGMHSLSVGEGFIFDGQPHVVCGSETGCSARENVMIAFNLRTCKMVAIPHMQQVQLSQINVEYTV